MRSLHLHGGSSSPHARFAPPASPHSPTLSLHDALPISRFVAGLSLDAIPPPVVDQAALLALDTLGNGLAAAGEDFGREQRRLRSEEHTSELQSPYDLVCRLLLGKKKGNTQFPRTRVALC